ncbi:LEA1 [[Candida] subhashii]|uniref:LEA1 n=1 Tax=[Candida] subhashii TaxID=561895 RepID=A0A8J5QI00_9ASCO|nr:LEA1 [[Candida] subhashii]KAG7661695.1 LEA1 [[Candida] subhashii]
MRLTPQVINDAPIILNPEKKLTLQLRDLQIPYIENLSITQDKFQVIDLTNNELIELSDIPNGFINLETLLLGNNNITHIDDERFPTDNYIKSISLINNNISRFQRTFSMKFKHLENLILIGNPITKVENYRLFMIWLIPSLKVLDFKKIKPGERQKAKELFGDDNTVYNELATSLIEKSITKEKNGLESSSKDKQLNTVIHKLTKQEREELLNKLKTATTIEEIERIETALKTGSI